MAADEFARGRGDHRDLDTTAAANRWPPARQRRRARRRPVPAQPRGQTPAGSRLAARDTFVNLRQATPSALRASPCPAPRPRPRPLGAAPESSRGAGHHRPPRRPPPARRCSSADAAEGRTRPKQRTPRPCTHRADSTNPIEVILPPAQASPMASYRCAAQLPIELPRRAGRRPTAAPARLMPYISTRARAGQSLWQSKQSHTPPNEVPHRPLLTTRSPSGRFARSGATRISLPRATLSNTSGARSSTPPPDGSIHRLHPHRSRRLRTRRHARQGEFSNSLHTAPRSAALRPTTRHARRTNIYPHRLAADPPGDASPPTDPANVRPRGLVARAGLLAAGPAPPVDSRSGSSRRLDDSRRPPPAGRGAGLGAASHLRQRDTGETPKRTPSDAHAPPDAASSPWAEPCAPPQRAPPRPTKPVLGRNATTCQPALR